MAEDTESGGYMPAITDVQYGELAPLFGVRVLDADRVMKAYRLGRVHERAVLTAAGAEVGKLTVTVTVPPVFDAKDIFARVRKMLGDWTDRGRKSS